MPTVSSQWKSTRRPMTAGPGDVCDVEGCSRAFPFEGTRYDKIVLILDIREDEAVRVKSDADKEPGLRFS